MFLVPQSPDLLVTWTTGNNKVIEAHRTIDKEPGLFSRDLAGQALVDAFQKAGAKQVRTDGLGNVIVLREGSDHGRLVVLVTRYSAGDALLSKASAVYSLLRLLDSNRIETKADLALVFETNAAESSAAAVAAMPQGKRTVVALDDLPLGSLGHRTPGLHTLMLRPADPRECNAARETVTRIAASTSAVRVLPGTACKVELEIALGTNDLLSAASDALASIESDLKQRGLAFDVSADEPPKRVSVGSDPVQVGSAVLRSLGMEPSYVPVSETSSNLLRSSASFVALGYDGTNPTNYGRSVLSLMDTILSLAGLR